MTHTPEEPEPTHPFLAKPVSPSGPHESSAPPPPPPPTATTPYGAVPGYPPYAPYGVVPGYPFAQAHTGANTAMGLGIASLVCALGAFVVCITIPGVLCGPFAIALAIRAQREMRVNPGRYNNPGAATTGLITGIIGTVIGIGAVALVVFFFGFVFSLGSV